MNAEHRLVWTKWCIRLQAPRLKGTLSVTLVVLATKQCWALHRMAGKKLFVNVWGLLNNKYEKKEANSIFCGSMGLYFIQTRKKVILSFKTRLWEPSVLEKVSLLRQLLVKRPQKAPVLLTSSASMRPQIQRQKLACWRTEFTLLGTEAN